jgi:glyoxylase-like metal-dependent hydrolase (beta-lactamase superfamily II)
MRSSKHFRCHPLAGVFWLGVSLAALAGGTALAQVESSSPILQEWTVSDRLSIRQIHPNVWIHISRRTLDNGVVFPGNGLVVRDGDALFLVDTAWGADITLELLDWIDAELALPVEAVVVTHFHDDSMGGTAVLDARGIPVLGGPMTVKLGLDADLPSPAPVPDLMHSPVALVGPLELFYPGPAHSRDNLVVWIPRAQVLFGSCALRSPAFAGRGNTADGDLRGWPLAIGRVRDRYPDAAIVVPGHGPAGDRSLLTHTIDLFAD